MTTIQESTGVSSGLALALDGLDSDTMDFDDDSSSFASRMWCSAVRSILNQVLPVYAKTDFEGL